MEPVFEMHAVSAMGMSEKVEGMVSVGVRLGLNIVHARISYIGGDARHRVRG